MPVRGCRQTSVMAWSTSRLTVRRRRGSAPASNALRFGLALALVGILGFVRLRVIRRSAPVLVDRADHVSQMAVNVPIMPWEMCPPIVQTIW